MDVLFWSELLVVQVSISIERPASTQKVRPLIGRPADVQIWSFNGSSKIGTRWTTAGYIKIGTTVKGKKLDVHGMSVTYNKRINRKWTIGYPMDVLWIMCASRDNWRWGWGKKIKNSAEWRISTFKTTTGYKFK